ncbi:hypothetical protein [Psychrobacter sp. JB385]|uniref:hypothetical protein n=1 Tax=Psychrobacter TaxID=497 RepID=UPI000B361778|nr:hypothetical protein [Psychrobacter sp. JB385]
MILSMCIPTDLRINELIKREDIPCFCKIDAKFILTFDFAPFSLIGEIVELDTERLSLLYPSGVGGKYTYYNHAMVSIDKVSENQYRVTSLKFFEVYLGWCSIIVDGNYAPEREYDEDF